MERLYKFFFLVFTVHCFDDLLVGEVGSAFGFTNCNVKYGAGILGEGVWWLGSSESPSHMEGPEAPRKAVNIYGRPILTDGGLTKGTTASGIAYFHKGEWHINAASIYRLKASKYFESGGVLVVSLSPRFSIAISCGGDFEAPMASSSLSPTAKGKVGKDYQHVNFLRSYIPAN